jgi:hypothetical protein
MAPSNKCDAGRPEEEARERPVRLQVPADGLLEPLLHHLAGVAHAQLGDTRAAGDALTEALAAARASELPFETVVALDALEALSRSPERRRERDALLAQLDISRVPAPPVVRR